MICRKCKVEKSEDEFDLRNDTGKRSTECKRCRAFRVKATDKRTPEEGRAKVAAWRVQLKKDVFDAYGNACFCCGEREPVFLALDHVNGGGRQHRLSLAGSSSSVYANVRQRGYPPDFQLLCHNCNIGKYRLGTCPHQV